MKKALLTLIVIFLASIFVVYQADAADMSPQRVIVTEIIPGAIDCTCIAGGANNGVKTCPDTMPVYERKYECTVDRGLTAFQKLFATIIRWFLYIAMLVCVMAIIGLGIAWSFAGADDAKAETKLKTWGINLLVGLLLLFMFRPILQFLAPWIYR